VTEVQAKLLTAACRCLAALFIPTIFWALALRRRVGRLFLENESLRALSVRDTLTGLVNHEGFEVRLDAEFIQAGRSRRPLSVVVAAIDHFETLGDLGGAHRSDRYIVDVARALESVVRKDSDLIARCGEEDFALVVPGADNAAALALAERLRRSVHEIRLSHRGSSRDDHVSISVGTATFEPGQEGSPASLMAAADKALRRARAFGGNRVAA
jgi:diguanylate cyclase (GGDEF)-like protein